MKTLAPIGFLCVILVILVLIGGTVTYAGGKAVGKSTGDIRGKVQSIDTSQGILHLQVGDSVLKFHAGTRHGWLKQLQRGQEVAVSYKIKKDGRKVVKRIHQILKQAK